MVERTLSLGHPSPRFRGASVPPFFFLVQHRATASVIECYGPVRTQVGLRKHHTSTSMKCHADLLDFNEFELRTSTEQMIGLSISSRTNERRKQRV